MINKNYEIFKQPYIRKADNKYYNSNQIMIDFIISLLPIILIGWYQNGIKVYINNKDILSLFYPLIFIILGSLFTFLIESLYFCFTNKNINCLIQSKNCFSIIPGLLLSLILPLNTPIWVLFIGCIFASIIGKLIYGGFGYNIFNPALVGYIFIMSAFYGVISNNVSDVISSSTPLENLNEILFHNIHIDEVINSKNGILNICFGLKTGTIAETSSIACFISFIYLSIREVIDIKTPLIILITFFISSFIIGIFIDINPLMFSLYNLFNGGIIFGAIFMATEPVTSPRSYFGKIIYAFLIGVIAIILRLLSDLRDGTSTAILFMNSLSLIIDYFGAKLRIEKCILKKLFKSSIIITVFIMLISYSILKLNSYNKNESNTNEININIISIKQDYNKLLNNIIEFNYTLNINNDNVNFICDVDGNILNDVSNYNEEQLIYIKDIINKNKINKRSLNVNNHYGYIKKIEKIDDDNYNIIAYGRGYIDNVIIIINYNYNNKIINKTIVDLSFENQLDGGLINSSGNKSDLIAIGEGKQSDIISGVTYTSVSLLSARKAIDDFIDYLNGGLHNG